MLTITLSYTVLVLFIVLQMYQYSNLRKKLDNYLYEDHARFFRLMAERDLWLKKRDDSPHHRGYYTALEKAIDIMTDNKG